MFYHFPSRKLMRFIFDHELRKLDTTDTTHTFEISSFRDEIKQLITEKQKIKDKHKVPVGDPAGLPRP